MTIRKAALVASLFVGVRLLWALYMYSFTRYYSSDYSSLFRIMLDVPLVYFLYRFGRSSTQEQGDASEESDGRLWAFALVAPVVLIVLGFVVARSMPHNQNDWIGLSYAIPAMIGLFFACTASIVFAVASFMKRERLAPWALLSAFPSAVAALWGAVLLLRYFLHR